MSIEEIQALQRRMDSLDLKTILQRPDSLHLQQRLDALRIPTPGDSIPPPRVRPGSLR